MTKLLLVVSLLSSNPMWDQATLRAGVTTSPVSQSAVQEPVTPPGLGRPTVHRLAENVLAVTGLYHSAGSDFGVNAGIIFADGAVIFIDSGMTIASAEYLWSLAAERLEGNEQVFLILTHHHADHVFGMRVFQEHGARVIGHRISAEWVRDDDGRYKRFIARMSGWDDEQADEILGDVVLSEPSQVIIWDDILRVGGQEIHLLVTPGHVVDEISVYHPASRVLFAGDGVYEGTDLNTRFGDVDAWEAWISQLERLKRLDVEVVVPGHGKLCSASEIDRNIAFLHSLVPDEALSDRPVIALTGSTVLNLSDSGHLDSDLHDATVLVERGRITAVGASRDVPIPQGTRVIDVTGSYVIPGLFDGFAALDNQSFANAYLYMGVTSIIGVEGGRRDLLYMDADPGPTIYRIEGVGRFPLSTEDLLRQIDDLADRGYRAVLLMYGIGPEQISEAAARAHARGLAVVGELGRTRYSEAARAGIDAFVHTTRYSLDIAPPELAEAVAADPFGRRDPDPVLRYLGLLGSLAQNDPRLLDHATLLGSGDVALMPTLSLRAGFLSDIPNPWKEPAAALLNPADLQSPVDRDTGRPAMPEEQADQQALFSEQILMLERTYRRYGAVYLAGSGTDVFGTMPGISLHTELGLLTRIGLTRREALAATTTNIAEAFGWFYTGSVEAGHTADILVLSEDPLLDLNNLKGIRVLMKEGRIVDRAALLRESG